MVDRDGRWEYLGTTLRYEPQFRFESSGQYEDGIPLSLSLSLSMSSSVVQVQRLIAHCLVNGSV